VLPVDSFSVAMQGSGLRPKRTALVHDFLLGLRGADRVFLEMCDLWPEADIFTPVYDERGTEGRLAHRRVYTSFLQKLRPGRRSFRALLPFYPAAIESFDLSGYDVVVSSSSAWAHAVICEPGAVHVCYCHNPFRYAWNERHSTLADRGDPITRAAARKLFRHWREWDWVAAQRVDRYITNSRMTQSRIKAFFGRSSRVVYPPVDVDRFRQATPGDDYLVLSELVSHKQIDVAIAAFAQLGLPLVVVGDGPALRRLRALATPNVRFTGRVGDVEAAHLMATCRAFVVTATEEFGIAAVEAQAAGRPVIARRGGGVLETIVDGRTGHLWEGGAAELADAVRAFDTAAVDAEECVQNALRFRPEVFRAEFPREVAKAVAESPADHEENERRRRLRTVKGPRAARVRGEMR